VVVEELFVCHSDELSADRYSNRVGGSATYDMSSSAISPSQIRELLWLYFRSRHAAKRFDLISNTPIGTSTADTSPQARVSIKAKLLF
jgi:hypothetical protein